MLSVCVLLLETLTVSMSTYHFANCASYQKQVCLCFFTTLHRTTKPETRQTHSKSWKKYDGVVVRREGGYHTLPLRRFAIIWL
jgi:hypothetical protein